MLLNLIEVHPVASSKDDEVVDTGLDACLETVVEALQGINHIIFAEQVDGLAFVAALSPDVEAGEESCIGIDVQAVACCEAVGQIDGCCE